MSDPDSGDRIVPQRLPLPSTLRLTDADHVSMELSSRRTGMSFQRTRMSADRTLMSIMRTALALIGFGFTIYQFFSRMRESEVLVGRAHAPRNFGVALVALGITMLLLGILYHIQFMRELRSERNQMMAEGLIHGQTGYPLSLTLVTALLLLLIGVMAIASMVFGLGPFD
jgi:putative membrane protein